MRAGRISGRNKEVRVACEEGQKGVDRADSIELSKCVNEEVTSRTKGKLLSKCFGEEVAGVIRRKLAKVGLSIVWGGCW
jgi:hypothetical protein